MCGNNSATVKKNVVIPSTHFKVKKKKTIISGVSDIVFSHFLLITNSPHPHNYSNTFSIGVDKEIYHTKLC